MSSGDKKDSSTDIGAVPGRKPGILTRLDKDLIAFLTPDVTCSGLHETVSLTMHGLMSSRDTRIEVGAEVLISRVILPGGTLRLGGLPSLGC